MTDHVINH